MSFRNLFIGMFAVWMVSTNQAALASDPLQASCQVVTAMAEGGADAGVSAIIKMSQHWPSDDRGKLRALLAPAFRHFEYKSGSVYSILDLGENAVEHLLVLDIKSGGVVYLRLTYEREDSGLEFAHVDFQSKLQTLLKTPFGQKPEKLICK